MPGNNHTLKINLTTLYVMCVYVERKNDLQQIIIWCVTTITRLLIKHRRSLNQGFYRFKGLKMKEWYLKKKMSILVF